MTGSTRSHQSPMQLPTPPSHVARRGRGRPKGNRSLKENKRRVITLVYYEITNCLPLIERGAEEPPSPYCRSCTQSPRCNLWGTAELGRERLLLKHTKPSSAAHPASRGDQWEIVKWASQHHKSVSLCLSSSVSFCSSLSLSVCLCLSLSFSEERFQSQ